MPCCSAANCSNHYKNGFSLYRFPSDPVRKLMWVQNCKRTNWMPTSGSRLCEEHFEAEMFENYITDKGRKKLRPNAIPTLFNESEPLVDTNNKPSSEKHVVTIQQLNEVGQEVALQNAKNEVYFPHKAHLRDLHLKEEHENCSFTNSRIRSEAVKVMAASENKSRLNTDLQIRSIRCILQAQRRKLLQEKRHNQKYKKFLSQFMSSRDIEKITCIMQTKDAVKSTILKAQKINHAFGRKFYRCRKWVINTLREDLKRKPPKVLNVSYSLCAEHFEDRMFINSKHKKRLVHDAIPTLFNIHTSLPAISPPRKRGRPAKCSLTKTSPLAISLVAIEMDHKYHARNLQPGDIQGSSPASGKFEIIARNPHDFSSSNQGSSLVNVVNSMQHNVITTQQKNAILDVMHNGLTTIQESDTFGITHRCGMSKKHWKSMDTQTEPPPRTVNKQTWMTRPFKTSEDVLLRKRLAKQRETLARLHKKIDTVKEQYKHLKETPKSFKVQDLVKGLEQYLTGIPLAFVATQLLMSKKKVRARKWPEEIKKLAMSIYKAGPKAYEILAQQFLLPGVKSVRQLVAEEKERVNNTIDHVLESCAVEKGTSDKRTSVADQPVIVSDNSAVPLASSCDEANAAVMMICQNLQSTSAVEHGDFQLSPGLFKVTEIDSVGSTIDCVIDSSNMVGATERILTAQQHIFAIDTPTVPVMNDSDKQNGTVVLLCQNVRKTPALDQGGLQWYTSLCRNTEMEPTESTVENIIRSGTVADGAIQHGNLTQHIITVDTSSLPLVSTMDQNAAVTVQCQTAQTTQSLEHGETHWYSIVSPWTGQ